MRKTYAHHKPTAGCTDKVRAIRKAFDALHDVIEANAPHSRERSVAYTELETAAMWAIKAAVLNDPESTPEDCDPDSAADAARRGFAGT